MVEGERILGRFTVAERIGGGGFGTVHRAWDERLCRNVAVKAIEGDGAGRVMREAHAAARLNHPGIVTLYELGTENGCAYLVSELVDGPNLRELAAEGGLSDREVAEFGAELCAALAHAHAAGVVHRDLKPDNVLIRGAAGRRLRSGGGERALLADFGIARVADSASLTATGQVVGTLSYMSPEQASGDQVGPASDVYSLALSLYELWAGFNPIVRSTPAATARAIGEPVESLLEARPELPPELAAAIDSCLSPEPEQRPGPVELRDELLRLRGALHPDRAVPEPADLPEDSAEATPVPRRPLVVVGFAALVALIGAFAGLGAPVLAAAALIAPAALVLDRARDWIKPALAAVLGLLGAAPAFAVVAAREPTASARVVVAALGWGWTVAVGALLDRSLGAGIAPLSSEALSSGLIWVGATILLGILLDVARPAAAAVGALIWAALLVAALGAVGGAAAPAPMLAPALVLALAWAIWDREDRPDPRPWIEAMTAGRFGAGAGAAIAADATAQRRPPRNPAAVPLADEEIRVTRAARRHVRSALHGAGSRAGVP